MWHERTRRKQSCNICVGQVFTQTGGKRYVVYQLYRQDALAPSRRAVVIPTEHHLSPRVLGTHELLHNWCRPFRSGGCLSPGWCLLPGRRTHFSHLVHRSHSLLQQISHFRTPIHICQPHPNSFPGRHLASLTLQQVKIIESEVVHARWVGRVRETDFGSRRRLGTKVCIKVPSRETVLASSRCRCGALLWVCDEA